MAGYIKKDELLKEARAISGYAWTWEAKFEKLMRTILMAPAVEHKEYVRCCECRKRYTSECPICAADSYFCTDDSDGHCHYGEREE